MDTAKLFSNGRSQAVRLPKEYRFDTDDVIVAKLDGMVVLYPRKAGWSLLGRAIGKFSDDFMSARTQPKKTEKRKSL
jgi:antitoxin VapB